jgi:hypothetical protein
MTQSGDDADALFRDADGFFVPAAELDAGSLAALHRLVGRAVAEGDYPHAQHLLSSVPSDYRDVPPEQWVSVAPGVLGAGVSLDGDDEKDVPGAGTFSVITSHVFRAVAALKRVAIG